MLLQEYVCMDRDVECWSGVQSGMEQCARVELPWTGLLTPAQTPKDEQRVMLEVMPCVRTSRRQSLPLMDSLMKQPTTRALWQHDNDTMITVDDNEISNSDESDQEGVMEVMALPSLKELHETLPMTGSVRKLVKETRARITSLLYQGHSEYPPLLVVVGPCSIHDPEAAMIYAQKLQRVAQRHAQELVIVMRAYGEKPRTSVGWKGLIHDPSCQGTGHLSNGLKLMRHLLLSINALGLPTAVEWLDPSLSDYLVDLVSWAAIGARTCTSQVHRELAARLPHPVGFKQPCDNLDAQDAVDSLRAAALKGTTSVVYRHELGRMAHIRAKGNRSCHVVLRGGRSAGQTNYDSASVAETVKRLDQWIQKEQEESPTFLKRRSAVMIDCAHGNSGKTVQGQLLVLQSIVQRIANGTQKEADSIMGVMLESFLEEGRQTLPMERHDPNDVRPLLFGQSVTDPCLDWSSTETALDQLAQAVKQRRHQHYA